MEQLKRLYGSLTLFQRISILALAPLIIFGVIQFSHWQKEKDLKPLFQNISAEEAGVVLTRLKESGVEYKVSDNGSTILVPSARVAELRLQMAAAGLPKTGRIGYELFDKTNLMTSDFAEQVNYRRALEGELERSITTLAEVEQARVHLTFAKDSVFLESKQPAKASVLLKLKVGARLSPANVTAVSHLTASAVEGLLPEAVSILDMNGNLLSRVKKAPVEGVEDTDASLEFRQRVERDLLAKINTTLEPLLGPERFRAGVSVDCDFSSGEQSEEVFDPNRSVITNSQRTEDTSNTPAPGGVPGTASNLPRPVNRPVSSTYGVSRRTENISYQTSRVLKKVHLPQGNIRRLSLSVLVDHRVRWEGSGAKAKRIVEPMPPERLKAIHDIIAGVTGFVADRGDQLVVESLPFESTLSPDGLSTPAPSVPAVPNVPLWLAPLLQDQKKLAIAAAGAAVLLLAGAAGMFMFLRKKKKQNEVLATPEPALAAAAESKELEAPASAPLASLDDQIAGHAAERERQLQETMSQLLAPAIKTKKGEALAKHLTMEAKKDPEIIAHLVRSWLTEAQR